MSINHYRYNPQADPNAVIVLNDWSSSLGERFINQARAAGFDADWADGEPSTNIIEVEISPDQSISVQTLAGEKPMPGRFHARSRQWSGASQAMICCEEAGEILVTLPLSAARSITFANE